MAKLRQNHHKGAKGGTSSFIRIIVFLGVLIFIMYSLYQTMISDSSNDRIQNVPVTDIDLSKEDKKSDETVLNDFLPCYNEGEIVEHKYYSICYMEHAEQSVWVAYELTKASIKIKNVKRSKWFDPDYSVSTGSAFHKDYTGSGYSRGHLAPAGDMAYSEEAMKESFLMSNISPQLKAFNGGIWNELENCVRDWAWDNDKVIVVTGPLLNRKIIKSIGDNKVKVPSAFYKIVLDNTGKEKKAIGFIIPNELSTKHLSEYVVSIDEIEKETGIDFFCDYMGDQEEERLESISNIKEWRVEGKRYQTRVNVWNNQ